MNRRLKFGIEEEYFITDLQTRCMPGQPSEAAVAECRIELGKHFAHEMFQSQVEVASPIFRSLPEAADYLTEVRAGLTRRLAPHGLGLLSAGSHPMATQSLQPTDELHFQQLFDDYQRVARRSVLSGLHVHVEVPADRDRIRVMNEVLPWLPMFLALSASSPFWNGAYSGFSSYRQVACDEWPRMGVPEFFEDETALPNTSTYSCAPARFARPAIAGGSFDLPRISPPWKCASAMPVHGSMMSFAWSRCFA